MPDSIDTAAGAASKVKIVEALLRLGKAVQKSMIYPDGHPAIPAAVNLFLSGLEQALDEKPGLSLGVVRDRILVEGEPVDAKNAALAWLGQQMYERGVGALDLKRSIPEQEGVRFVRWLARPLALETASDSPPSFEGIALTRYDYARVRFGENPSADPDVRTDPTRVWLVLMGGLFGEGNWDVSANGLDDPEELARVLCARLAAGEGDSASAVASRVIAMGTKLTEFPDSVRESIKRKIGKFIGGLTPEMRSELLRVDPRSSRQKLEFVTEMADALPDGTVLEILGNLDRTGAHIPHQFLTLMNKLIGISADDQQLQTQVGEKLESMGVPKSLLETQPSKMREVLEEVLQSRLDRNYNPEQYQVLLEHLSMRRVSGASASHSMERYGDPRSPEDVRAHVSEIALQLLVARPGAADSATYVRCLDEDAPRAVDSGRFEQLHQAASAVRDIATSQTELPVDFMKLADTYLANFTKEERIEKILAAAMGHHGPLPQSMLGLFRIAGADAGYLAFHKLAELAEAPEIGRLTELLVALEPVTFTEAVSRLRSEGWSSLRPLFPVLQKIGGTRAVELALTFLGNEDHRVRAESYRVLFSADQRPGQAERYVERGLADESSKVVALALGQARQRGGSEISKLVGAYLCAPSRHQEEEMLLRAISTLAAFRTEEARDILIGLLKRDRLTIWVKNVRKANAIGEALTQIGDEISLAAVREWRRSPARWLSVLLVQGKVAK